jgi:hypothetical protein
MDRRAAGLLALAAACTSGGGKPDSADTASAAPDTGDARTELHPECGCLENNAPVDPVDRIGEAAFHLSGKARIGASGDLEVVLNPVVRTGTSDRIRSISEDDLLVELEGASVNLDEVRRIAADDALPVDLVFVLDTTGSMIWAIDGVRAGVRGFLRVMTESGADVRVGAVEYGDATRTSIDLTTAADVRSWVGGLSATGGGDAAENPLDAIRFAEETFSFRPEAMRYYVLVTDQGMHECGVGCAETTLAEVAEATRGDVLYGVVHAYITEPAGVHPKKLVRAAGGLYVGLGVEDLLDFDIEEDTNLDQLVSDTHLLTVAAEAVPAEASQVTVTFEDAGDVASVTLDILR